ncbi:MAG TPA: hypothetical protein PK514_00290 [Spirochaetota bacterium]|nr:hypothetical protein [Spirochaetota bacterium]
MKEIDKTKENIKVSQLDDSQRKKLFQQFVDAGGQVQTERQARRNLMIDRNKQKEHQKKLDAHYSRLKKPVNTQAAAGTSTVSMPANIPGKSEDVPFEKFRIRMRLRFQGITRFSTLFYKNRFLNNMNLKYRPALMELQNAYLALFKQNPKRGNQVIMRLDKISPIYYELLQKTADLYEPIDLRELTDNIANFPDVPRQLPELKTLFNSIFRKLYIIKTYENTIYNAFDKAIDICINVSEDNQYPQLNKRNIRNALYIAFYVLYPRLHTLFCQYNLTLFDDPDSRIDDMLEIIPAERPGNRVRYDLSRIQQETEAELPDVIKHEEKASEINIDPIVTEGLKNMYKLDFSMLRKKYDKTGTYEILGDNDKVLLAYLLYLEFDNEYAMIFTTNRIKYNMEYLGSNMVDYRKNMQELYNSMRKSQQAFNLYHESFINYSRLKNQKPSTNDQYINYSKQVDELIRKKDIAGSGARMAIKIFMEKTATELDTLVRDMNERQMYISNPQDIIELNPEIEGEKKLHGLKIYEALQTVRNFAAAFAFRLGPEGDLYGKLEYNQKESGEQKADSSPRPSPARSAKKSQSILDELDDIL